MRCGAVNLAGEQVLSRYQRRRKPENLTMMLGMEGFKRGFGSGFVVAAPVAQPGPGSLPTVHLLSSSC